MDRKIENKRFSFGKISLYALGLIAVSYLVYSLYNQSTASRLNVNTERLLLDTIKQGVFQEFIPVNGIVQPIKTVFLDAVEGGRVEEILTEDGSMVNAHQEILRLSNPDLQLNYLNQEANIVSQINQIRNTSILMEQQSLSLKEQALDVEYQLDLVEKRQKRNAVLISDKVISRVEFQESQDEYEHLQRRKRMLAATIKKDSMFQQLQQDQMNSSLDLMKRNLNIARKNLDNLSVKAPISG